MSRSAWCLMSVLVAVCVSPTASYGIPGVGWPVYDVANHFNTTISAAEAVTNTAKWILEQLGLPSFVITEGQYFEHLATLKALIEAGGQVGFDVHQLQAQLRLFGLDTAPGTSLAYADQMGEMRGLTNQAFCYARQTQAMVATTLRLIRDVSVLAQHMVAAVGGKQMQQTIAQHQAELVALQSELRLQQAAYQNAQSIDQLTETVIDQSSRNISRSIWADWREGDRGL